MQELKKFINNTFKQHMVSEKDNDIIIQFKREDNTIQSIYAQVFKLKTGEYVFNLVGSLFPDIAVEKDFNKFKKKVKEWSKYV